MAKAFGSLAVAAALLIPCSLNGQRGRSSSTGRMQIPVQKSGKVVIEGGGPLPEPAIIEAVCGASAAVPLARTDSKGGFIVGRGRDADVDARMQRGAVASVSNLAGCSLQARIPGYLSSVLSVVDNEAIDLGAIVLRRVSGAEGVIVSATGLRAPKDAQKAMEKARASIEKKKSDQARPQLEKAVEIYPEYAEAWFELGRIHQGARDLTRARDAYERSIKADPKYVKPYMQLAGVLHQQRNWQAAAEVSATLIKLDPESFAGAYVVHAICNLRLGNAEAAETSARKAIKLDTAHAFPEVEYALGILLGDRGNFKEAVEHLETYLRLAPNSPGAEGVRKLVSDFGQAAESRRPK